MEWAPPWRSPRPFRASCACQRAPSVTRAPHPRTKEKSPSVTAKAATTTSLRRAACVKTSRAAERTCSFKWCENFLTLRSLNHWCFDWKQTGPVSLLSFFFAVKLLHSSPGVGVAHFPNGRHSDQLPAGVSGGQQQPGSARSQWITHSRQDRWNDRPAHGMNQMPKD